MPFYPDYQHSILNLACSIARYFGVEAAHPGLPEADRLLAGGYRNVVLLVFDALGSENLRELLPEDSFLRRHLAAPVSSVFPPTTTAATTTLDSGLSPAEHGWLGWTVRFPELNDNVALFTNSGLSGRPAAPYEVTERFLPYESIVSKINRAGTARAESVSEFGTCRIHTLEELTQAVQTLCGQAGRHYLSAYWNEPDSTMHATGVASPEARAQAHAVNSTAERLAAGLSDTLLLVTADHGHIDIASRFLPDYPDLADMLECPPSIEARALAFFVKPGRKAAFEEAFRARFGEEFLLFSREEAVQSGLFGPGVPHPRFRDSLGDYLAAATGNTALFLRHDQAFRGFHAGLTKKEMLVPLIAAAT